MKTYGLRPREVYPYGIVRCFDDNGLNRAIEIVEGAKKEEDDICVKCKLFHEDCPKPSISENMFIIRCRDYATR